MSVQDSGSLNYFPSAVPDSPPHPTSPSALRPLAPAQPLKLGQNPLSQYSSSAGMKSDTTVLISIGSSREPVPLMRYEVFNSSTQDIEEASYELVVKSKAIQSKFSKLVLDVCSLLQDSSVDCIEKLQMWLSFQMCTQTVKVLSSDSDISKAKTIPALISSLKCYSSWYNYGLIADIVRTFCGDKGTALVQTYEAELKDYLQTLVFHCPPLFPGYGSKSHMEYLEVKVGWDTSTALLEDISIFKHTVCQLCDLDPRFVVVKRVASGNFQMSLAIPVSAVGKVNEAIKLNPDAFLQNNIQAVKLSGSRTDLKVGLL